MKLINCLTKIVSLKNNMQLRCIGFFFLFSIHVSFFSQTIPPLKQEIEKLKKDKDLINGAWSLHVININKDSVIADYNSNLSLIPASTLKTVTTAAALSILGSAFKFETKLEYDGKLDTISHILKGNLYIKGGGDPSLESEYFKDKQDSLNTTDKWARIIKKLGINQIDGAIIGDASIFEDNITPEQWIWGDMGNYFGAGACGLTYMDNKYSVLFNSGANGTKASISKIIPAIDDLQLINNVTANGSNDNAIIYGAPYSFNRFVDGTIPGNKINFEVYGSIPDPALFCAQSLEQSLIKIGIKTTAKASTIKILKEKKIYTNPSKKSIYIHYSPTLDKIVYWTNLKSINLFAEHLLKYICFAKIGFGTESDGTEIITNFWKTKNVNINGFYMNDGCGLARANVITTKTEAQILKEMVKDKNFDAFYNSLPIAGKTGSLASMCNGTCAENNLRAKSGYITRVRSYTGYVKNKKGELLCFSVIANNFSCSPTEIKNKLEKILVAIAEN